MYFIFFIIFWVQGLLAQTPISIQNEASLDFGTVLAGSTLTIPPGNNPSSDSARFEVTGEKRTAYTIILPTSGVVRHNTQTQFEIALSGFQSNPPEGNNGLLAPNGKQKLWVGATLGPVPFSTPAGNYSGSFVVEVIY